MSTPSSDLWIETDHNRVIVGWAADILRLTGYRAGSMYGLLLTIMFIADGSAGPHAGEGVIRSRDDRATRVRYRSEPSPHSSDVSRIITRWTFEPI